MLKIQQNLVVFTKYSEYIVGWPLLWCYSCKKGTSSRQYWLKKQLRISLDVTDDCAFAFQLISSENQVLSYENRKIGRMLIDFVPFVGEGETLYFYDKF